jgi:phosphoglycerate dehydrogenase-like enzyme
MRVLFAAHENGWGGFFGLIRSELPEYEFLATGRYGFDSLKGFDVLIPTMSRVSREMLETNDRLRLIQQAGAGLEGVDLAAARDFGIYTANVPAGLSGNADSVAELGIYMLIGLSRDIPGMAKSMSSRQMGVPPGRALMGKTVGLVGLGSIGEALVRRLKAFNVHLIAVKRSNPAKAKEDLGLDWVGGRQDLPELLSRSDYVILCLPMSSETKLLMNRETFSCMKQGAFLINLARGGLVDRDALEDSLASGRLAGAGLDVFWEEPPDPNDPIFSYNVLATPHIGGGTDVSVQGIVKAVAENLRRLENNLELLHLKTP